MYKSNGILVVNIKVSDGFNNCVVLLGISDPVKSHSHLVTSNIACNAAGTKLQPAGVITIKTGSVV